MIDKTGSLRDREGRMELTATNIAVDQQRAITRFCERQCEVRRDQRLAVARSGARNRNGDRAASIRRITDVEAESAEGFDQLCFILHAGRAVPATTDGGN